VIALLQRVRGAHVDVANLRVGEIGHGMLVFVCAEPHDDEAAADKLVAKLLKLRVFADDAGKMNRSVQDVQGGLLIVSQFTLAADTSGGNRPGFSGAAPPPLGRGLYERVVEQARLPHPVHLVNDGPVTIPIRL
jgi:D-aminoacyl-tRNA deacylase